MGKGDVGHGGGMLKEHAHNCKAARRHAQSNVAAINPARDRLMGCETEEKNRRLHSPTNQFYGTSFALATTHDEANMESLLGGSFELVI